MGREKWSEKKFEKTERTGGMKGWRLMRVV